MKWNELNQSILEIDFDWTFWNERGSLTFRRFGISKYHQCSILRNTFQCYRTRIKETISFRIDNGCEIWKIYIQSFRIISLVLLDNGCEIWKIYIQSFRIISLVLRIVNEHDESCLPFSAQLPSVRDCNDGRSIQIISFTFIQYFQLLLRKNHGIPNHPM